MLEQYGIQQIYSIAIKALSPVKIGNKQYGTNEVILYLKDVEAGKLVEDTSKLEEKAEAIKNVKNFLLFNVIYEMNAGKDEEANFFFASNTLEDIIIDLKRLIKFQ